jgi:NAD(P)-dependent dehydrogenase (short-subunit alcohol dehydrogenase family)
MTNTLENKTALITGGTSGIGEATVALFVAEGAKVLFTGRDAGKGSSIEAQLGKNARFFHADVLHEKEIQASVDQTVSTFGSKV